MDEKCCRTEDEFLEKYDGTEYEKPSVTVDLLIFTIEEDNLKVVMVKRDNYPFRGCLSLPGVFVDVKETLDDAAKRALRQKTGLDNIYFEQLYTWGDLDRDPRMRVITVSYLALVPSVMLDPKNEQSKGVSLYNADELLNGKTEIAFDHKKMISCARERIKNKVEYTSIAFRFLPIEFTLPELQKVYEILLGRKLYKANFRKKVSLLIVPTDKMTAGDAHRPSRYYTYKKTEEE